MIKISNLEKYQGKTKILDGINLEISRGELVTVMGPSGSGKSTLMYLMGGLDRPTSGEVVIDGQEVGSLNDVSLSKLRGKKIGFVFQAFYLQPFLTVEENVMVPMMFMGKRIKEMKKRAEELVLAVGLAEQRSFLPKQLSGGQMQRVAIARALANSPEILLADEPTGNLDAANGQKIIELFKKIREKLGTTIVVVTHNLEVARQTDRIIKIRDGRIIT